MTLLWTDDDGDTLEVYVNHHAGLTARVTAGAKYSIPEQELATVYLPPKGSPAAKKLVLDLAREMDVHLDLRPTPFARTACVQVIGPDEELEQWTVSGDINDGLTWEEKNRAHGLVTGLDGSLNYAVQRLLEEANIALEGIGYDPEFSCFFAYARDEDTANALAALINSKTWVIEGHF